LNFNFIRQLQQISFSVLKMKKNIIVTIDYWQEKNIIDYRSILWF